MFKYLEVAAVVSTSLNSGFVLGVAPHPQTHNKAKSPQPFGLQRLSPKSSLAANPGTKLSNISQVPLMPPLIGGGMVKLLGVPDRCFT